MKALAIHGAEDIRLEDRPEVTPGPEQVRIRVKYVGICGSDLHYYFHGANGEFVVREPLVPGHELSAVVDLDPSGEFAPGTPVTVHPARYGEPIEGLADRPHVWPGGSYLGSASTWPHTQGAAAEHLVVDRSSLRRLPEGLPLERAALAEPLGVALRALTVAGEVAGKSTLVLGSGPIGLLVVAALAHRGAASITAGDLRDEPLERATALGATTTLRVDQDAPEQAGYDLVFECSSAPVSLTSAIRAVAHGGVVVQVGILPNAEIAVNLAPMLSKEAQLIGSWRFVDEIDEAVAMLATDPRFDDVVTHVLPMTEAVQAFEMARDSSRSAKVLLQI